MSAADDIMALFTAGTHLSADAAAVAARCSRDTAYRALAQLEGRGLLLRVAGGRDKAHGEKACVYTLPVSGRKSDPARWWTEERIGITKRLNGDGLSAAQIAAHLGNGATKSMVTGKLSRLRENEGRPPRLTRPRRAPTSTLPVPARAAPAYGQAFQPLPGDTHRPWTEREEGQCAWPLDVGAEVFSCCRPRVRGSYCATHAATGKRP